MVTSNKRITMTVISAVLLNAIRKYNFVGSPLWRMSDGKDLVRVELTFHKNQPTTRLYKKGAESRGQPAPSAGEWLRQPVAATTDDQIDASTSIADAGEGDATTSRPDTETTTIRHQRQPLTAITKTCLFKYIENFITKKWNFSDKKFWYFSYFCSKHRLWVLVRTASARRF